MIEFERGFMSEGKLPFVYQIIRGRNAELPAVVDWFREQEPALRGACDRFAAVLVRGFAALDSAQAFSAVLGGIGRELMDYVGGSAPRSVVYGRVFNATALPSEFSLPLHQEMAYQEYRPDSLALFCHRAPVDGGETTLADARLVTSRIDARVLERCEPRLEVIRALPRERFANRTRPWMDVFGTSDHAEAERIASDKGWKIRWCPDDTMQLHQSMPTFRNHPRTGVRVWANQLHYHTPEGMVQWSLHDGRMDDVQYYRGLMSDAPEKLDHVLHADGTPVSSEEAEHIWDVLSRSEVAHRWEQGDVLILDNVLAMHGRRAFRGERSILVGMMRENRDAHTPR